MIGVLGNAALTGPDELAIYVGYQPSSLAAVPGTRLVAALQGTPGPAVFTRFFRYAFAVGVLGVLFPILILIGMATRLAAARREAVRRAAAGQATPGTSTSSPRSTRW